MTAWNTKTHESVEIPQHHESIFLMRILALIAFICLVVGCGSAIGFIIQPGEWYAGLAKAPFSPPNWVFAPVWTILYVLIAIAGWRIWRRAGWRSTAMKLWIAQLALNFSWTPVFFGAHLPVLGLVIIVATLAVIVAFIVAAWPRDRVAAWLFVPYALWVAFATSLNAAIVVLN
jgi:tryptophan-rich sensory protein